MLKRRVFHRRVVVLGALLAVAGCDIVQPPPKAEPAARPPLRRSDDADSAAAPQEPPPRQEAASPARPSLWEQVLGPAEGALPPARGEQVWFDDLGTALQVARAEKRPILVVASCPERSSPGDLSAALQQATGTLESALRQFVPVRLTDGWKFDFRLLASDTLQDPDCTEWVWMLSDAGAPISCFGGRTPDGASDVSLASFEHLMGQWLRYFFDPRRHSWNLDRPSPEAAAPVTARDRFTEGYPLWKSRFRRNLQDPACLRCHHTQEMQFLQKSQSQISDKATDMLIWPPTEQAGFSLRDGRLEVLDVTRDSPAASAGLEPGDELGSAFQQRIFSAADLRATLNAIPNSGGVIPLRWKRRGAVMEGRLLLPPGWRERSPEQLSWRASLLYGPLGPTPGFIAKPLGDAVRRKLKMPENSAAFEIEISRNSPALARGILPEDILITTNQQSPRLDARSWMLWFRRTFDGSRPVTFDLISSKTGKARRVSYVPFSFEPTQ